MGQHLHTQKCGVCGSEKQAGACVPVEAVRPELAEIIAKDRPDWAATGYLCRTDLAKYRRQYVSELMHKERSDLSSLDKAVIASIAEQDTLTQNVETAFDAHLTVGDRWADRVASFGGSWMFIGLFAAVVVLWMAGNAALFVAHPFDPYPFILLNLLLSCIAAVQAPLIMMSQRRQEAKDRLRSQNDYSVNLKAELEIRLLHEKLDHLLVRQWERLAEIQQMQLDMMEEIAQERPRKR
ncbi:MULTISPECIES: DUF1003 domain-containing protein [Rhodomicrobium]|uniref:DUF1003 domain-containing protein n=1 Tax=Rhodomicrobium TaxID=1068 RepID=UPI000B4AC732|nr:MULTISPECIES: DUF1003 domain-containing protein [Rhodomicrobium]